MMFNKILVGVWILLSSVLIIENIIVSAGAYLFLPYTNTWTVIFVSVLIWISIWFWIKWLTIKTDYKSEDDYDF